MSNTFANALTLVVGGTGKTGRRVVDRLRARGQAVRVGSRSSDVPFDWDDDSTWTASLDGVDAVYMTFAPDLAVPEAPAAITKFAGMAAAGGVKRLVLLSGRGEEAAQQCERIVLDIEPSWSVVRAGWFNQNFDESFMRDPIRGGLLALPAGDVREPFVDCDDIADVAVACLTESGHEGKIYEVTGPRLLNFTEAVEEIARAVGRDIRYVRVPGETYAQAAREEGTPEGLIDLTRFLFETVLDGRNEYVTDGVQQALGRPAKDFADYARETAASGAWAASEAASA